ncbi:MAG: hypothetical protein IKA73_03760 [Alphaproteobacteria bacterium]|nr:hypothetical protein [Alphaproteobacteria bacterium]
MYLKRFGFLLLAVSAAFCTPVFAAITSKEYVDEHVKNQVSTLAAKSEIPTKVSDLENDSGFITAFDIPSAPNVPTKVSEFENDAKYVTETAMGTELSSYAKTATVNTELAKKANTSDLANYATTSAMNTALAAKADSTELNSLATKTELSEGLSGKQDTLTTAQQNAVNSGITADKVSTYDGYASQIAGKQAAGDYATNSALTSGLSGKQDTLTTAQQNAVNSGITADKVSTYDGYAAQIAGKQAAGDYALKSELPTATSDLTNDSGFITNAALADYAKTADVNTELAKKANTSDLANYATTSAMNTALAAKADSTELNSLATKTELSEGLAGKQATLTTAQQNAVNSGITADKVSTYDGYAAQIAGKQAAGDYATNTALTTGLSGKQDTLTAAQQNAVDSGITAGKVSTYDGYAAQISAKANAADLSGHIANTENPHAVTKAQVGLGNVQNVDQTNASNLTSGTVAYGRLPVGTAASTVAAGNDVRFNTIPTTQPSGTPPSGQVFIWFN